MTTTPALLGVDGGGTSTTAWLADEAGQVLGQGRSGASNVKAVGADSALAALDGAIASAFAEAGHAPGPVEVACLGLAGFETYLPRYEKRRRHARRVETVAAPLFPRYLFVAIDLASQRWRSIHSTIGVSRLVCNGEDPAVLADGGCGGYHVTRHVRCRRITTRECPWPCQVR